MLFLVFVLYALAGPVNTFRSVDKVRLEDVVGDREDDDAEFVEPTTDPEKSQEEQPKQK